ncbi:hypothetical protein GIB67_022799, partial [Kingdonia uniflora]
GLYGYEGTPLAVVRFFLQKWVSLSVPSLSHAWYLGEWRSLQDMFGDRRLLGDRYLDQLRGKGWVDSEQFFIDHISYNLYWARVSTPYILPDYSRIIKANVIGPRVVKGQIISPRFKHSMPQETQFTQEDMDTSTDPT